MRAGQGKKWGQVGGYSRAHKVARILGFPFCFCLRHSPHAQTAFTVRTGVCAVGWARKATERKRELLKLSKVGIKTLMAERKKEEEGRERIAHWRFIPQWTGVCEAWRGVFSEWCRNLSLVSQSRRCDPHLITACLHLRVVTTSSTITNYCKCKTKLWISFGKFCQCSSKRKYLTR